LSFGADTTEGMRLTSTGLGIGTSSPTFSAGGGLHISNATAANLRLQDTTTNVYTNIWQADNGSTSSFLIDVDPNNVGSGGCPLVINTAGSMKVTLSSSGNLGIGVTPSAWSIRALQVGSGFAAWSTNVANARIFANTYYDGAYKYMGNGRATQYEQDGYHAWYLAANNTSGAGAAIPTWTQAMTLTSAGDLALGATATSGNSERLYVAGTANLVARFKGTSGGLASMDLVNDANKSLGLVVYASTYSGGSSFNVGANGAILGSTTAAPLCVGTYDSQPLLLGTNSIERGRFTAGGVFIVGTASTLYGELLNVTHGGVGQNCATFYFNTTDDRGNLILRHARASGATQAAMIAFLDSGGTERGSIKTDGSATAYNTSSDRRLKENIMPANDAGSVIDSIEIVQHDWKDGGHVRYGMIAQDLHQVAPEAVSAGDDGEEIQSTWGVDYSKLVPMLVKEIQSLRSRVAALEAK